MCQMKVLLKEDEQEELVAEQVTLLEVVEEGVSISTLFEEPQVIAGARVARVDFLAGKVTLTRVGKP